MDCKRNYHNDKGLRSHYISTMKKIDIEKRAVLEVQFSDIMQGIFSSYSDKQINHMFSIITTVHTVML